MTGDENKHLELVGPPAEENNTQYFGNEYSTIMAPSAVEACLRLGLHPGMRPIFEHHLQDLHLVVREGHGYSNPDPATLDVMKFGTPDDLEPKWRRTFIVRKDEIRERQRLLTENLESFDITSLEVGKLQSCALDWFFYEQAMTALGNSYFMQNRFGNYMSDFNGQSPYVRSQYAISTEYLQKTGKEDITIEDDFKALKDGFGLMMLHETLLAKGVVTKATMANWIIARLRSDTYPDAYRSDEISEHFRALQPNFKAAQQMIEFAMNVFDPELED